MDRAELSDADVGYVNLIAVSRAYRRSGIAAALLSSVESWLEDSGATKIIVGPYSPRYFSPGIDVRYAEAHALFESAGYLPMLRPLAMKVLREDLHCPTWLGSKTPDPEIELTRWRPELTKALLDFAAEHFAPDWARFVRDAVDDIAQGDDPSRLMVA